MHNSIFVVSKTLIYQVLSQVSSILMTLSVIRSYDSHLVGAWLFGLSIVGYINLLSDQGFSTQGVKDLVSGELDFRELLTLVVCLKNVLSIIMFIFCVSYTIFRNEFNYETFIIVTLISISIVNSFNLSWYFNAYGLYAWYFLPRIIANVMLLFFSYSDLLAILELAFAFILFDLLIILSTWIKIQSIEKVALKLSDFSKFDIRYLKRSFATSGIILFDFLVCNFILILPGLFGNYQEVALIFMINKLFYFFFAPAKNFISLYFLPKIVRMNKYLNEAQIYNTLIKYIILSFVCSVVYTLIIFYGMDVISWYLYDEIIEVSVMALLVGVNFILVSCTLPLWLFRISIKNTNPDFNFAQVRSYILSFVFIFSMLLAYYVDGPIFSLLVNTVFSILWFVILFYEQKIVKKPS